MRAKDVQAGAILAIMCPHCDGPSTCEITGVVQVGPDYGDDARWPLPTWVCLTRCRTCHEPIVTLQEDVGDPRGLDTPVVWWPRTERNLNPSIPLKLRRSLTEARKCFGAKAYFATVTMVRRTLEGLCIEHSIKERDLAKSLKALKEKGVIEGRFVDWMQDLRGLGNVGAHFGDTKVSRNDARDALDLAEAILDYVYVFTEKYRQFKKRRPSSDS